MTKLKSFLKQGGYKVNFNFLKFLCATIMNAKLLLVKIIFNPHYF